MLIRINSLLKGYSGIRLSTVEKLLELLNKGVTPYIPEKGSLGASGDLAPLAHMVLPMLGLGRAYYKGELLSGQEALDRAGIEKIQLAAKEGLALINGTTVLTGIGALATYDGIQLLKLSDIAGALSMEVHNVDNWQLLATSVTSLKEARTQQLRLNNGSKILIHSAVSLKSTEPARILLLT